MHLDALTAAPDKCNGKTPGFLLHVKWFISMQPVAAVCNCTDCDSGNNRQKEMTERNQRVREKLEHIVSFCTKSNLRERFNLEVWC